MTTEATFRPIKGDAGDWNWGREDGVRVLTQDDQAEISSLLMGHKVTKVDGEHLLLDSGVTIKAIGHDGGCACSAGCYDLSVLNGVDNIITRVEYDYQPAGDWGPAEKTGHPDDPRGQVGRLLPRVRVRREPADQPHAVRRLGRQRLLRDRLRTRPVREVS